MEPTPEHKQEVENPLSTFTTGQLFDELQHRLGSSSNPLLNELRSLVPAEQTEVARSPEATMEEKATIAAKLIHECGFAVLHGKFPDGLCDDNGLRIGENNGNNVRFQSSGINTAGSDISIFNDIKPSFLSAVYSGSRILTRDKHYVTKVMYSAEHWKSIIDQMKEIPDVHLSESMKASAKDGMVVYTVLFFIDKDSPNLGNGTRGHDIPLHFIFAIPKTKVDEWGINIKTFGEVADFPEYVYEKLYPGLDRKLIRVAASESVVIKASDRNTYRDDDPASLYTLAGISPVPLSRTFGGR